MDPMELELRQQIQLEQWLQDADEFCLVEGRRLKEAEIARAVLEVVVSNGWWGACHATACVMTVLFREQGLAADPYLGECRYPDKPDFFDHSWVETEAGIYDVAVVLPRSGQGRAMPPVFAGKPLGADVAEMVLYDENSGLGDAPDTQELKAKSIAMYMEEHIPGMNQGLWEVCVIAGEIAGLQLNADELRERYKDLAWKERPKKPVYRR
jgi:hypothetical protein